MTASPGIANNGKGSGRSIANGAGVGQLANCGDVLLVMRQAGGHGSFKMSTPGLRLINTMHSCAYVYSRLAQPVVRLPPLISGERMAALLPQRSQATRPAALRTAYLHLLNRLWPPLHLTLHCALQPRQGGAGAQRHRILFSARPRQPAGAPGAQALAHRQLTQQRRGKLLCASLHHYQMVVQRHKNVRRSEEACMVGPCGLLDASGCWLHQPCTTRKPTHSTTKALTRAVFMTYPTSPIDLALSTVCARKKTPWTAGSDEQRRALRAERAAGSTHSSACFNQLPAWAARMQGAAGAGGDGSTAPTPERRRRRLTPLPMPCTSYSTLL